MKISKQSLLQLEQLLQIRFDNLKLLYEALTHSSYIFEMKDLKHNERLEFLGDSVLQLTISEYLYNNYADKTEGELTKLRALIVCENSLYQVAQNLNLGRFLFMSKGEELTGGRERISILADCVEAVIAAIYLDKGIETAKTFIINKFQGIIEKAISNKIVLDYKTKLQEELQKEGEVLISYNLDNFEGPPHHRKFYTTVSINNKVVASGSGFSKKEAEQAAAKQALSLMEDQNANS